MTSLYRSYKFWVPVTVALLLSPVAFTVAWISVGIGHPSHGLAISKILFPYMVLFTLPVTGGYTTGFVVSVVPVVQVIAYGILVGRAWYQSKSKWIGLLLAAHILASLIAVVVHPDDVL